MRRPRAASRRAAVAIVVALAITALVAAGALVVDLGYQRVVGAQLQASLDAAALAGAAHLGDGPDAARAAAITLAARNAAGSASVALVDEDVEIGTWDTDSGTFVVLGAADEARGDTVQVTARVAGIPTFLARVLGVRSLAVTRGSLAGMAGGLPAVCGIIADVNADLNGSIYIDSYDSTEGAWSEAGAGAEAAVCSNGDITASGNTELQGSLRYGPDTGDTASVGGSATVTGDVAPLDEEIVLPTADSTAARTTNNNASIGTTSRGRNPVSGTSFSMNSTDRLTLNAGTYYFTAFTLNGQARVSTVGHVDIYVKGDAHLNGGGILNTSANPADLTIYVDGAHSVQVNGSADFYGSIIAPDSEVHVNGNADYYGILVSDRAELNGNGDLHVDTSLVDTFVGRFGGDRRAVLRR